MTTNVSWVMVLVAAAALQWLIVALFSTFSRSRFPKKGMRTSERVLLGSTAVLALSFLALADPSRMWKSKSPVTTASATGATTPRASCASIEVGMSAAAARTKLGEPDETISDEETRGPGASVLVYKGSRCAVHVFDGKVEFVD
jgi:hypothetical protein